MAKIKLRRDTTTNWTNANPVLALGEPGYDTDTKELRIGDGISNWGNLTPITGGGGSGSSLSNGDYSVALNSDGTTNIPAGGLVFPNGSSISQKGEEGLILWQTDVAGDENDAEYIGLWYGGVLEDDSPNVSITAGSYNWAVDDGNLEFLNYENTNADQGNLQINLDIVTTGNTLNWHLDTSGNLYLPADPAVTANSGIVFGDGTLLTSHQATFGNVNLTTPSDGFAVVQSSDSQVWGTQTAVDPEGNIYTLGGFYDNDWDGDDRPTLIKYSPAGERLWAKTFRYNDSLFGGMSYTLSLQGFTPVIVFTNWYQNNRVYVVKLVSETGAIVDYQQINNTFDSSNTFYPRSIASNDAGKWIVGGELQGSVTKTDAVKNLETGSTQGIAIVNKSLFTAPNYPNTNGNWYMRTTYGPTYFYNDYIYYVNRFTQVPVYNLFSSGVNANLYFTIDPANGQLIDSNGWDSSAGTGYALNDIVYTKGTDLGVGIQTDVNPIGIPNTAATWSWYDAASRNLFTITDGNINTVFTDLRDNPSHQWKVLFATTGAEYNVLEVYESSGSWLVYFDGGNLGSDPASNLAFYNATTGTSIITRVTYAGDNGELYGTDMHGVVQFDKIKLDTQGSTDFGRPFQMEFTSYPGVEAGNPTNIVTTSKSGLPYWADVTNDGNWTVTDGTNTRTVTNVFDYDDGYITYQVDGDIGGQGTVVTLTNTLGKYEVTIDAGNNGVIIGSDNVNIAWGNEYNQRFNVVALGGDNSIYAVGYDSDSAYSMIVKFNSTGGHKIWDQTVQNNYENYENDAHGLVVTNESGTEYAYLITYDDYYGATLFKFAGSDGSIVWSTYIGGYNFGDNFEFTNGPSLAVDGQGNIVVAGRMWFNGDNNSSLGILRFDPGAGGLIDGKKIKYASNDIYTRYEGDEADYQFVVHDNYFIGTAYFYNNATGRNQMITFKVPLNKSGSYATSTGFSIIDVTTDLIGETGNLGNQITSAYTNYSSQSLSNGALSTSDLIYTQDDVITSEDPYFIGNSDYAPILWPEYNGVSGVLSGVGELSFADGSTQSQAYNPLMGSVTNNDYYYYPKLEDAGKFIYTQSNWYVGLYDDAGADLPIGFAVTIISPPNKNTNIIPQWNNYPPNIVVPGQDVIQNTNPYSGWNLKAGGMATILKVAADTWYISGGALEMIS